MDRARRLGSLWNWLPVFRAVAEMEHFHGAAKVLHVSASSVSRTIRLLEADVGHELFTRSARNVRLNDRGRALLASVRDAMRLLDDGVASISDGPSIGTVRLACAGDYPLAFLWRALRDIKQSHADLAALTAHVLRPPAAEVSSLLLRGELDVAFGYSVRPTPHLKVATIATVTHGIYCGARHPLFKVKKPTLEQVLGHDFVAPALEEKEGAMDFWPIDIVRKVSIYLPALSPAIEICAEGDALAVLPDGLPGTSGPLRRLPIEIISPVKFFAVYRKPLVADALAERIANAMGKQLRSAAAARR